MFDIGTKTIQSPSIKLPYSNGNIYQIYAIHSKNHIGKTFNYLKEIIMTWL